MSARDRILTVIFGDLSPIRFIMGIASVIISLGFLLSSTDNINYDLINLIGKFIWFVVFAFHAVFMFEAAFFYVGFARKFILSMILII